MSVSWPVGHINWILQRNGIGYEHQKKRDIRLRFFVTNVGGQNDCQNSRLMRLAKVTMFLTFKEKMERVCCSYLLF